MVQTFEWLEEEIIQQMCHINIQGRVVTRGAIDAETGAELARFTIEFARGIFAYIPVDAAAADRLAAEGLPFFSTSRFCAERRHENSDVNSRCRQVGVSWTRRLLKTFRNSLRFVRIQTGRFGINSSVSLHITRGTLMHRCGGEDEALQFRVPPVLHPSVKHLLVNAPILYGEHLHRTFLDAETESLRMQPMAWVPGNRVFQIRTSIYPRETILDFSSTWDVIGMSETGAAHFFQNSS